MHKFKLAILLCEPSLGSGTAVVVLSFLLLSVANFSYLLRSGFIYETLFGKNSAYELIETSRDTFSAFSNTIFSNHLLNQILFFAFWMMVGLFVYVIIAALSQTVSETGAELKSMRYVHAHKRLIEQNIMVRWAIRIAGILAGFLYGWVFIKLLFPFSVLSSRIGLGQPTKPIGWFYIILSIIVLMLSLHGLVIISRLITVRPRVFGGWDSLLIK